MADWEARSAALYARAACLRDLPCGVANPRRRFDVFEGKTLQRAMPQGKLEIPTEVGRVSEVMSDGIPR